MSKLTDEQIHAIDLSVQGNNVGLIAAAGSGKTFTLQAIGQAMQSKGKQGIVVVYNKAIQKELETKMSENVWAQTIHGLAYKGMEDVVCPHTGRRFVDKITENRRETSFDLAKRFEIGTFYFKNHNNQDTPLHQTLVAKYVMDTLEKFCQVPDHDLSIKHVAHPHYFSDVDIQRFSEVILPLSQRLLEDGFRLESPYSISFEFLLKTWYLRGAAVEADFIMLDEAQDTNPLTMQILRNQNTQLILTGDPNQMLYGFRGAYNFLTPESLNDLGVTPARLTQSFRFGPRIADYASNISALLGDSVAVRGNHQIDSRVHFSKNKLSVPRAVLCRSNSGVMSHAAQLMSRGLSVSLLGDKKEDQDFIFGVQKLQNGESVPTHPLLNIFSNYKELQEFTKTPSGKEYAPLINIIDKKGVDYLANVFKNSAKPADADVIVATVHQSKGLEFSSVALGSDFKYDLNLKTRRLTLSPEELRIMYVGMTRAISNLDLSLQEGPLSEVLSEIRPTFEHEKNFGWGLVANTKAQNLPKDFNKSASTHQELTSLGTKTSDQPDLDKILKAIEKKKQMDEVQFDLFDSVHKPAEMLGGDIADVEFMSQYFALKSKVKDPNCPLSPEEIERKKNAENARMGFSSFNLLEQAASLLVEGGAKQGLPSLKPEDLALTALRSFVKKDKLTM